MDDCALGCTVIFKTIYIDPFQVYPVIPESQDTHGMALFMNSASVATFSILTCFSTSRYNSGKIIHEYPFGTEKKKCM